ncbi:hypothetical protein VTP01DRAFT_4982 [Rhizomucor pusillus]|uniref:uncharacterized protein n=1 Tax=Rhizomucor pusillus TaxID=4840 RepID=UPI003743C13F
MQDYYQQNVFGNDYPNIVVLLSLTGTLSLVFTNGCASLVQILISYVGVTWSMTIGSLLLSMGLIFAGFSTQVWHLYLTQGILFGLGSSICYVTSMGVVPQYFERKRGLAMGIVTSGTGVGGLIVPFIMDAINQSLGGAWTYRILGFICLASNVVTVLLVRERVPRSLKTKKKFSDIIQFEILKDVNFDIWCVIACLQVMGYFLPYFYLPSYATHLGLSASDGTAIVSVTSAANIVGRILAGIVADRIGHLSTNIIFTFISALSAFLIWTFAYSYGVLMAFGVVFGLVGGSYSPLISPITASVIGMEKLATGFSLTLLFTVIALWSPMISSAIEDSVDPEPFLTYKMYTGVTFLLASLTGLLLKLKMKRNLFVKF